MFEKCFSYVNTGYIKHDWNRKCQVFPFIMKWCKRKTDLNDFRNIIGCLASLLSSVTLWSRDLFLLFHQHRMPLSKHKLRPFSRTLTNTHLCLFSVSCCHGKKETHFKWSFLGDTSPMLALGEIVFDGLLMLNGANFQTQITSWIMMIISLQVIVHNNCW